MSLALVYEEAFKIIVRLQAGKLKDQTAPQVKASILAIFRTIDAAAKESRESMNQATQGRGTTQGSPKGSGIPYPQEVLDDAKFAIAALADESASRSHLRDQWKAAPGTTLVLTVFPKTGNAGNEFYARLERIGRMDTTYDGELLEVYCLCLLLGYMGVYSGAKLTEITKDTLDRTARALGRAPGLLVGEPYLKEGPTRTKSRLLWAPIAGALAAVLYAFFWGHLAYRASELADLIRAYRI
jgi:type IV/VI secretion system ImpK/VasF family protein